MTPHLRAMYDLLSDGQWHDRDAVLATGGQHVPVGQSARWGARRDERRGIVRDDPQGPAMLLRNSREVAGAALRHAVQGRRVEQDGRRYRLAPALPAAAGRLAPRDRTVEELLQRLSDAETRIARLEERLADTPDVTAVSDVGDGDADCGEAQLARLESRIASSSDGTGAGVPGSASAAEAGAVGALGAALGAALDTADDEGRPSQYQDRVCRRPDCVNFRRTVGSHDEDRPCGTGHAG